MGMGGGRRGEESYEEAGTRGEERKEKGMRGLRGSSNQ